MLYFLKLKVIVSKIEAYKEKGLHVNYNVNINPEFANALESFKSFKRKI